METRRVSDEVARSRGRCHAFASGFDASAYCHPRSWFGHGGFRPNARHGATHDDPGNLRARKRSESPVGERAASRAPLTRRNMPTSSRRPRRPPRPTAPHPRSSSHPTTTSPSTRAERNSAARSPSTSWPNGLHAAAVGSRRRRPAWRRSSTTSPRQMGYAADRRLNLLVAGQRPPPTAAGHGGPAWK